MRAWVTIVTGDGPAIAEIMGMKTPGNAYSPCRTCSITGVRSEGPHGHYYVPHTHPMSTPYPFNFERPPVRSQLRRDIGLVVRAQSKEYAKRFGMLPTFNILS